MRDRPPRFPRKVAVECETDRPFGATLVNISPTGCLLRTEHLEAIATRISLSVMIPTPESERVLDEERSMTDFAGIYARAKARQTDGISPLSIKCITLPGSVVRHEREGEEFNLGVRFRWLARKQRDVLEAYLGTLPIPESTESDADRQSAEQVFRMYQPKAGPQGKRGTRTSERGEITSIRFSGAAPLDTSPLSTEEAREWLDVIDERDLAFLLLLRALRRRASYAALFVVKGSMVYGRMAVDEQGLDNTKVQELEFSLEPHSPFRQVANSGAFFVGPLGVDSEEICEALKTIGGGDAPTSALLLPIIICDRLVAIAVAHSHTRGFPVAQIPGLLGVVDSTSDAVYRYLLRGHSEQRKTAANKPIQPGGNVGRRLAPEAELVEIFARIESGDPTMRESAFREAITRADETIRHLDRHFPGKLTRARDRSSDYVDPGTYGPVLSLVKQLGVSAAPLLSTKMGETDADMRYFATLCAVGLGKGLALDLVERLFDEDAQVAELALVALEGMSDEELSPALEALRRFISAEEGGHIELAACAKALVRLGDTRAVENVIGLLNQNDLPKSLSDLLHSFLVDLSCQDFGINPRKWSRWYGKNKSKSRIDWLLEGLQHKSPDIRKNADSTLRRVTGLNAVYDVFASKQDRARGYNNWVHALEYRASDQV